MLNVFYPSPTCCLETEFLTEPEASVWLGWLASDLLDLSVSAILSLVAVTGMCSCAWLCRCKLGIQTQVLCLQVNTFPQALNFS